MDLDELYEICYECTGYGDDYYFDKETGEYESAYLQSMIVITIAIILMVKKL